MEMRRKDRQITDREEILRIVDKAKVLHLGIAGSEYPYVVPLHFGYEYADGSLVFYLHCAKEGRKLDLIRENPRVCVEMECSVELVSGGDLPCKYGSRFASVIGFGRAEIVSDEQEKRKGLALLMKNQTGRDFEFSGQMAATVEVIRIIVTEFTAKARS